MPVIPNPYRCMLAHTIDVSRLNYSTAESLNIKLASECVTGEYL